MYKITLFFGNKNESTDSQVALLYVIYFSKFSQFSPIQTRQEERGGADFGCFQLFSQ